MSLTRPTVLDVAGAFTGSAESPVWNSFVGVSDAPVGEFANLAKPVAEHGSALADPDRLRALLEDYPTLLDYEAGIVLHTDDTSARVYFVAEGEQPVDLEAVSWAAPFLTDETVVRAQKASTACRRWRGTTRLLSTSAGAAGSYSSAGSPSVRIAGMVFSPALTAA